MCGAAEGTRGSLAFLPRNRATASPCPGCGLTHLGAAQASALLTSLHCVPGVFLGPLMIENVLAKGGRVGLRGGDPKSHPSPGQPPFSQRCFGSCPGSDHLSVCSIAITSEEVSVWADHLQKPDKNGPAVTLRHKPPQKPRLSLGSMAETFTAYCPGIRGWELGAKGWQSCRMQALGSRTASGGRS